MSDIKIIDFGKCGLLVSAPSEEDIKTCGQLIVEAMQENGFVYVKNLGVSKELINEVNESFMKLFQAPLEKKQKHALKPTYHGYIGVDSEQANPETKDSQESFNIRGAAFIDQEKYPWPNDLSPGFSKTVKEYMVQCELISQRILRSLAFGLNLQDKDHFKKAHTNLHSENTSTTLRGFYFEPMPNAAPNEVRFGEHSDFTTFTLLNQTNTSGLQARNRQGEFVDIVPIQDTFVLYIGDTLEFWTKNQLRSTKHRMIVPLDENERKKSKQILAYYVAGREDHVIDDLEIVDHHGVLKLHPATGKGSDGVTIGKYIETRMADIESYQ